MIDPHASNSWQAFALATLGFFCLHTSYLFADADPNKMRVRVIGMPEEKVWVGQKVSTTVQVMFAERPQGSILFDVPEASGGVFLRLQTSPFFTNETIDGIDFTIWNYKFVFYPHRAGTSQIPSITVRVTSGDEAKPIEFEATTEPFEVEAKLPEGAESLQTLVSTTDLKIEEKWQPGPPGESKPKVGDAFTRTITLTASDVLAMGFPSPSFGASNSLKVYPKAPGSKDTVNRGDIKGQRTETVVYVCQEEGQATIPKLTYPWLNLDSGKLQSIEFGEQKFEIAPNPDLVAPPQAGDSGTTADQGSGRNILTFLLIPVVLITGMWLLWPRISPHLQQWREKRANRETNQFRRLLTSVKNQDWPQIHQASSHWLKSLPNNAISSLQQFADDYGSSDLAKNLTILLASEYSRSTTGDKVNIEALTNGLKEARARFFSKKHLLAELAPLN